MERLGKMWRGEYQLAITFWVYLVVLGGLLSLVGFLPIFFAAAYLGQGIYSFIAFIFLAISLFILIYLVFICVAVWRSANKYVAGGPKSAGVRLNAIGAKLVVVLFWVQIFPVWLFLLFGSLF